MSLTAKLVGLLAGPTGATGLYQRSGSGAPTSSTPGEAGEYYADTTAGAIYGPYDATNGWPTTAVVARGPKGLTGAAGAASTDGLGALVQMPGIPLGGSYSLSSSWQTIGSLSGGPDNTQLNTGCSLVGLSINIIGTGNLNSFSIGLYSSSTSSVLFTIPITGLNSGPQQLSFLSSQYPLPGPAKNYLQASGDGTVNLFVTPTYAVPQMVGVALQAIYCAYLPANTTYTTTPQTLAWPNTTGPWTYLSSRTAYLYGASIANNSSGAVQLQLYDATNSKVVYTTPSVSANSKMVLGPLANSTAIMRPSIQFTWRAVGSGTGSLSIVPRVIA